jgi:hypothetical protein
MKIVFDLDNTIVDERGRNLRPGIIELLTYLFKRHTLILWSSSSRQRGEQILKDHNLQMYFKRTIFREDYLDNSYTFKDIAIIKADYIIDDDPKEIDFNKKKGQRGFLVKSYRGSEKVESLELKKLKSDIEATANFIEKIKEFFR